MCVDSTPALWASFGLQSSFSVWYQLHAMPLHDPLYCFHVSVTVGCDWGLLLNEKASDFLQSGCSVYRGRARERARFNFCLNLFHLGDSAKWSRRREMVKSERSGRPIKNTDCRSTNQSRRQVDRNLVLPKLQTRHMIMTRCALAQVSVLWGSKQVDHLSSVSL